MSLIPKLRLLNLSNNALEEVANLSGLSDLEELNLSNNRIRHLPDLHTKLGNVKTLLLAQNRLTSLDGLAKLYGLVTLDVCSNRISELETIRPVASLPCLEELTLTGNPVTTVLDFRTKVLTMFGKIKCHLARTPIFQEDEPLHLRHSTSNLESLYEWLANRGF